MFGCSRRWWAAMATVVVLCAASSPGAGQTLPIGSQAPAFELPAPGGKVLYRKSGPCDPLEIRKAIVGYLGHTYQ
jgi:hypothetical protein